MAVNKIVILKGRIKTFQLPVRTQAQAGQGSTGYIAGVVTELGVGVSRRVMCYHRMSGILVTSTTSSSNGAYRLNGLIAGVKYYVTSIDESNDGIQYNAVTQDLITASEVTQ